MFFSISRAGLAILCITNSVLARNTLTRRAADCVTQCQPMQSSIAASETGGIVILCTSDVANQYKTCLACEIAISLLSQQAAQGVADSLVSSCKTAGHPIDAIAVTAINPTDAPAPVTSTPAPTPPATVTSDTGAPLTPTSTPTVPGSVSLPEDPVSSSNSNSETGLVSISSSALAVIPISPSVSVPLAPAISPTPTIAGKPASAGAPAGTAPAPPAESTVDSTPPSNGVVHYSGGLGLVNVVLILSVMLVGNF
ncbi:hypothetical protein C8R44DRAFT_859602 [Mycena epipterygia]|nr:hypothetical protein C8R44DRAFT_859602 [Mycena epipterygia]